MQTDASSLAEAPSLQFKTIVVVSEDAMIAKSLPNSNHGLGHTLKIKKSDGPHGHDAALRFIIPQGLGVLSASLILCIFLDNDDGGTIVAMVMATTASPWSETFLTWNGATESGTKIGSIGPARADKWIVKDVLEVVSSL